MLHKTTAPRWTHWATIPAGCATGICKESPSRSRGSLVDSGPIEAGPRPDACVQTAARLPLPGKGTTTPLIALLSSLRQRSRLANSRASSRSMTSMQLSLISTRSIKVSSVHFDRPMLFPHPLVGASSPKMDAPGNHPYGVCYWDL